MPKEKALVVDDDSAIRYTLTEALRACGYDPFEASTVAAALESFDAEWPSAVLQDVNLPDGPDSTRCSNTRSASRRPS